MIFRSRYKQLRAFCQKSASDLPPFGLPSFSSAHVRENNQVLVELARELKFPQLAGSSKAGPTKIMQVKIYVYGFG